jgi:hypothetical protein
MVLNIQPDDGSASFVLSDGGTLYYPFNSCLRPGELLAYTGDGVPYCGSWYGTHTSPLDTLLSSFLAHVLCAFLVPLAASARVVAASGPSPVTGRKMSSPFPLLVCWVRLLARALWVRCPVTLCCQQPTARESPVAARMDTPALHGRSPGFVCFR